MQATNKRARSPDGGETACTSNIKRAKLQAAFAALNSATPNTTRQEIKDRRERLRQKEERQQAKAEFVIKYTKAFPSFVFYFDERDCGNRQLAESRVLTLGASIEHFFSSSVTHVITNQPQPPKNEQYDPANKENMPCRTPGVNGGGLKSPIQLKGRNDHGGYDKLVRDAVQLDKKIWSISKLDNILSRLLPSGSKPSTAKTNQQSPPLTQLLQHERLHGTTSERDPREKRHDYQYFSKGSYFFLVEDIWGELAPIAIMEYPPVGRAEKDKTPTYPVLYMDPRARSPFLKFDEKEARKLEKLEANEKLKQAEKEKNRVKIRERLRHLHEETQRRAKTLRKCASMSELGRRAVTHADVGGLGDEASGSGPVTRDSAEFAGGFHGHQQGASSIGPSTTGLGTGNAYLAASGNSVALTSTATTSFARRMANTRLPPNLRQQLGRQVITSRRPEGAAAAAGGRGSSTYRFESHLRKSKSTTTMRLPKREESKKPGYCEACRVKFEDFAEHTRGSRHRTFAQNENNYLDLDFLLHRLERKPKINEPSDTESQHGEDGSGGGGGKVVEEDDPPSDACLGPGDYFYLSPDQELQAEVSEDDDDDGWEYEEKNTRVPRIVVDDENC